MDLMLQDKRASNNTTDLVILVFVDVIEMYLTTITITNYCLTGWLISHHITMICLIFHNVKRSVFLKSFTRNGRRKRMKPGIVNEALPDLFCLHIGILMFHLLHVDIKMSSCSGLGF